MTQEEDSMLSSIRQLRLEQGQRSREQARLAHLGKNEHARELPLAEAARAAAARLQQTEPKGDAQRLEHEQQDRQLELERAELSAKLRLMQLEQQSLQRLALQRDAKVRSFEGQRAMPQLNLDRRYPLSREKETPPRVPTGPAIGLDEP